MKEEMFDCYIRFVQVALGTHKTQVKEILFKSQWQNPSELECYQAIYAHIYKDFWRTTFDDFMLCSHESTFVDTKNTKGYKLLQVSNETKATPESDLIQFDGEITQEEVTLFMNDLLDWKIGYIRHVSFEGKNLLNQEQRNALK